MARRTPEGPGLPGPSFVVACGNLGGRWQQGDVVSSEALAAVNADTPWLLERGTLRLLEPTTASSPVAPPESDASGADAPSAASATADGPS